MIVVCNVLNYHTIKQFPLSNGNMVSLHKFQNRYFLEAVDLPLSMEIDEQMASTLVEKDEEINIANELFHNIYTFNKVMTDTILDHLNAVEYVSKLT